jgi:alanine dehydrogenase
LPSMHALTTKLVSLFPENSDRPTHQALICCFDSETGTPLAVMDGTQITAARTAAGSALATRLLARRGAGTVAIIGSGVQAEAHALALARLSSTRVIIVAGRNRSKVEDLVERLRDKVEVEVQTATSTESAVEAAQVICCTTSAASPVLEYQWIQPGTHVNAVGYNPAGSEIDNELIQHALVVVESRAAALAPAPALGAPELQRAISDGIIAEDHVRSEIGELAAGLVDGRTDDGQITLYRSIGVAIQDAAASSLILRAAQERGVGQTVQL